MRAFKRNPTCNVHERKLYQSGKNMLFNGYRVAHFKAPLTACRGCELRPKCLRHPERTVQRQLTIIKDREGERSKSGRNDGAVERMKLKLSTARGREIYGWRLGTVEPVLDLERLVDIVDAQVALLQPGERARIREEYSATAEYALVLDVREDGFDPASLDGNLGMTEA